MRTARVMAAIAVSVLMTGSPSGKLGDTGRSPVFWSFRGGGCSRYTGNIHPLGDAFVEFHPFAKSAKD
jgi:hypothetical protein